MGTVCAVLNISGHGQPKKDTKVKSKFDVKRHFKSRFNYYGLSLKDSDINMFSSSERDVLRAGLNSSELFTDSEPHLSLFPEDGLYDSVDGSSTELPDLFEEDCYEGDAWSLPVADLQPRITAQLESYLSNENLTEDAFLLKHVQRNRMGYVSLKLLTSFKKIRELTRDWRATLAAARSSRLLEVNEEGTKVRRTEPVPDWLLCIPTTKLLLAWNLLGEQSAEEAERGVEQQGLMGTAMRLFGCYGTISSLRILRPGKELPAELRRYSSKHLELGRKLCAVVEYEYLEGARKAHEALRDEGRSSAGRGVRVAPLGNRGVRKLGCSQDPTGEESEDPEDDGVFAKKPNRKARRYPYTLEDSALCSSSESDFAPASPRPNRRVSRPKALYGSPLTIPLVSSHRSDPYCNPLASPLGSPLLPRKLFPGGHTPSPLVTPEFSGSPLSSGPGSFGRSKYSGDCSQDSACAGSPWVWRRKTTAQAYFPEKGYPHSPGHQKRPWGVVEVVRQPNGPDGTRGFYNRFRGQKLFHLQ
ncbi:la-related protein 6b [Conger conger]|uniref:la-related protein 6b n=1 Tax=Conger conger TaxID=82655 RepID=UPI002A5A3827|nr:la-related protein 6b [Conger conger]